MYLPYRPSTSALCLAASLGLLGTANALAQEWTEARVLEAFLNQSPYAREANARVAIARAEARGRTLYSNPSLNFSREGAGLTEFFQAKQTLPLSGRLKLLRQAGDAAVRATEADGAFSVWQVRSALRKAFYRTVAAQQRHGIYTASVTELESVLKVLRDREREGEGSKFDRLRTEREKAELLAELALLRAEIALERGLVTAFLPPGTSVPAVTGSLDSPPSIPPPADLVQRALNLREDYRAEVRRAEQFRFEQRAAERLRIPEPILNAGLKRADLGPSANLPRTIANGPVFGVTIPLPIFNKGQTEVARFAAEQERSSARLQALTQQIKATVESIVDAFQIRSQTRDAYRAELAGTGPELIRIATVAYQEGEIGILQLLDVYRAQRSSQLRMLDIHAAVKEAQIELERVVGEEFEK